MTLNDSLYPHLFLVTGSRRYTLKTVLLGGKFLPTKILLEGMGGKTFLIYLERTGGGVCTSDDMHHMWFYFGKRMATSTSAREF
jgi:hypothetical protein